MSLVDTLNDEDKKKLFEAIQTCTSSKVRIASERDLIKETVNTICKELQLSKKVVNKMVSTYYKQNYDEEVVVQEQFEDLYTAIIKEG
jgi:hypothetical protein